MEETRKHLTIDNADGIARAVAAYVDERLETWAENEGKQKIEAKVNEKIEAFKKSATPVILSSENTGILGNDRYNDMILPKTIDIDAINMTNPNDLEAGSVHAWDFTSIPPNAIYHPGWEQDTSPIIDNGSLALRPFMFGSNLGHMVRLTPMAMDGGNDLIFTPFSDTYGNLVTGKADMVDVNGGMVIEFWFILRKLTQAQFDAMPSSSRDPRTTYIIVNNLTP